MMHGRVLIVDDEKSMCELLTSSLSRRGFQAQARTNAADALTAIGQDDYDVVVTDLNMPAMNGNVLCSRIAENRPDIPVVVVTAFGSLDTAVQAIRAGAYDFITKPFELEALIITLQRAIQHRSLREEVKRLRKAQAESAKFDELIGQSPVMKQLFDLLERVSKADASILITGESGTGKELVARALHRRGRNPDGPFVAVNCAAMPESLLESELFGHAKGAFTDAKSNRTGLFLQAQRGTLFLDEIGEMPLGLQPKLLRALQERKVRPVGSEQEVPFDARIICATNRDLESAVEEGRFREDLLFRINVITVEIPPLRARGSDVLLIAQHLVERFANRSGKSVTGISTPAADKLLSYPWPGNVRELQNCIERAVALTGYEKLAVEDLPEKIRAYSRSHVLVAGEDPTELVPLEEVERRYILRVLEAVGGNKTMASRILGLDRKTLYRRLERYGVGPAGAAEAE